MVTGEWSEKNKKRNLTGREGERVGKLKGKSERGGRKRPKGKNTFGGRKVLEIASVT